MNRFFHYQLRKFLLIFFDDISVYSRSWEEHLVHLDMVLDILDRESLYAKESKCDLDMTELLYLGHIISTEGICMDPEKICAIMEWPSVVNLT